METDVKVAKYVWCIAISLALVGSVYGQADCTQYNFNSGASFYNSYDYQQHSTGLHGFAHGSHKTCTYSGTPSPNNAVGCNVTASAQSSSGAADTGVLAIQYVLDVHNLSWQDSQGAASGANGAGAIADSEGAAAVKSCVGSCAVNISINGSGEGAGYTVSFSPTPLWADKFHDSVNCPGETLAKLCTPSGPPPTQSTGNGYWQWNYSNCSWVWVTCPTNVSGCQPTSPIVVDTTGKGFDFTDPKKGDYVSFDMRGDGMYEHVSWTQHGSGNAWLVYDRDGDGIIKDGTELFGNFTPHSNGDEADLTPHDYNGFLALAYFDKAAQGGNVDAMLDKKDAVWPHLKLWIDGHCYRNPDDPCHSTPDELYTLESKGVYSLSLVYEYSPNKTDAVGNVYKFYAVVNPDIHDAPTNSHGEHVDDTGHVCCDWHKRSKDGRLMYDVFLVAVP